MRALRYPFPHSIFSTAFTQAVRADIGHRRALLLSANQTHARWWQSQLSPRASMTAEVHTLQSFLLRSVVAATGGTVLSAYERLAFVEQAWAAVGGDLYARYGKNRGASAEIAAVLSFVSGQRTAWGATNDIDTQTELGAVYAKYQSLLIAANHIAYDDVALHYNALPTVTLPFDVLHAYELHEATPAQFFALRRMIAQIPEGIVGAWLHPDAGTRYAAPELAATAAFLAAFPPAPLWEQSTSAGALLTARLDGTQTAVPAVAYSAMTGATRIGVDTSTDELQLAARLTAERLRAGGAVSVVCADAALIVPLRAALAEAGVPLPVYSPAQSANPLIQTCQRLIAIQTAPDERTRRHTARACVALAHDLQRAQPADTRTPDLTAEQRFLDAGMQLVIDEHLSTTLAPTLASLGLVDQTWASDAPLPNAVRDHWLREWRQWLTALESRIELDRTADIAHLVDALDATPTPERVLRENAVPLQIVGPRGAPATTDTLIVIGLHEGALPRSPRGYQLVSEEAIGAVFREPIGYLPARTARAAVREREQRRAARLIGSDAHSVVLSVAYHGITGKPQLPTAFFERWGAGALVFDDHGSLQNDKNAASPPARVWAAAVPLPFREHALPQKNGKVLEDNHFSSSQLDSYLRCPRKYFYEKVARTAVEETEGDGDSATVGQLVHEVLCAAMGTGALSEVDLREETMAAYAQKWAHIQTRVATALEAALAGTSTTLPAGGSYTPSQRWETVLGAGLIRLQTLDQVRKLLQQWYESEQTMDHGVTRRPLMLEHSFSTAINGMTVVGRIDRIDAVTTGSATTLEIIDYKTGSAAKITGNEFLKRMGLPPAPTGSNPRASEGPEPTSFQTAIYLLAPLPHETGFVSATTMRYVFLKEKELVRFRTISIVDTAVKQNSARNNSIINLELPREDLIDRVVPTMTELMNTMRHTPYDIKPGRACNYCDFVAICDAEVVDENREEA